jgi:PAS domain S-box-containing protein
MEFFVSLSYVLTGVAILSFLKPALSDRDKPENQAFVVFIIAVALYAFFDAANLLLTEFALSLLLQKATITAGILIGVSWLSFAVVFSEKYTPTHWYTVGVGLYVVVAVLGTWLNVDNLIIGPEATVLDTLFWADPQIGFFLLLGGAYLQILLGTGVFAFEASKSASIRRKQAILLSLALLPAVLGSLANAYVLFIDIPTVDFTIYGFAISGGVFAVAMYSGQFLDIKPIARQTVVSEMDEAVITVDANNKVVDCNASAKKLCDVTDNAIGMSAAAFFDAIDSDVISLLEAAEEAETVVTAERDGETRYYQLSVSAITESVDRGRVVIIRDITAQKARETQLERQNEQLEEFAEVVAHDLRNPLGIAEGRVMMLQEETGDKYTDHLRPLSDALDRMEEIITDTLTLARKGQTVGKMNPISLSAMVDQCWESVETNGATLEIDDEITLEGDRDRLRHVFENLFRNAIEHGGADVTIRVGYTDDSQLYVEDDGPGIPPDKRETVFEAGHTSANGGTGIGLAIVKRIAEAHGWEVSITEGRDGGARFEFDNVTASEK